MSIKPLHIETVFTGGIHLLWLTLFSLYLMGKSPDIIFCYLSKIESGTAVVLVAILFAVSFFLGRLAEHFLIAANFFCIKNKIGKLKMIIFFEDNYGEVWGNKIFYINSFVGLAFLIIMLLILSVMRIVQNLVLPVILIGVPLVLVTWISYKYWHNLDDKLKSYRIQQIRRNNEQLNKKNEK